MDITAMLIIGVVGFFTAIYASMVGSSTLITIPTMILLGLPPSVSIATNRVGLVVTAGTAACNYFRHKKIHYHFAIPLGAAAFFGSIIGAYITLQVSENILKNIITAMMIIIVIIMISHKKLGVKKTIKHSKRSIVFLTITTFFLGIYAGFYGASFKTLILASLVTLFGMSFINAAATAATILFLTSISASVIFIIQGAVNYEFLIPLCIGNILGAYIGSNLAVKKDSEFIKKVFIVVVIIMIIKLIFSN